MLNAHELNSHSRFAHAQRLTEATEYRLAQIATLNRSRPSKSTIWAVIARYLFVRSARPQTQA